MRRTKIHRLVYASTVSRIAAGRLQGAVEDILVESVRCNRRDGVTGFLLCDGMAFAQVLEGPAALVQACYGRIGRDARNEDLNLRLWIPASRRMFPRWSMCALLLSDADDTLLRPLRPDIDLRTATAGALLQRFAALASRHGPELDAAHQAILARM